MAQLITVVGNAGVGKTTLTQALVAAGGYHVGLEQHGERPFQAAFARELAGGQRSQLALANQIDYLLYRAEQERWLRSQPGVGIQDGGLDLDYHLFSKQFAAQGYLTTAEHELCTRLYTLLRTCLPPPELIIHLTAPLAVVAQRHAQRGRPVEIATGKELAAMAELLHAWLDTVEPTRILTIDASTPEYSAPAQVTALVAAINARLQQTPT